MSHLNKGVPVPGTTNTGTTGTGTTGTGTTPTTTTPTVGTAGIQVVPGQADINDPNQINVTDYAGQIVGNPSAFFTLDDPSTPDINESMLMQQQIQNSIMDPNAPGTIIDPITGQPTNAFNAATAQGTAAQAGQVDPRLAQIYQAMLTQQNVTNNAAMTGAQGTLSGGAQINTDDILIDTDKVASGSTGTGQALNDYASQGMEVVDLSTPEGRVRAAELGEGNYVDYKATMQGQLAMLQNDFVDEAGNPTIPAWASQTARNVSRIATFSGMTGTAATMAMATAIMEASIPIAQQDSQFFQTITLQNLNNRQEATLNKANVLAKMDLANMDNRMAAAVSNAQSFLKMDLANLDNDQQARLINTQARVQAILEDANSVNAARLFAAESQNDMDRFYDNLNASIDQFNTNQYNEMQAFNTNEANAMNRFNSTLENNREQFYKNMQYNIDLANAQWRQTVTLTEDQQAFEAAATDVKNMVGVSVEQLNQIWDRSDALLDYLWKSSENALQRDHDLLVQQMAIKANKSLAQMQADIEDSKGTGALLGTILGNLSESIFSQIDWF